MKKKALALLMAGTTVLAMTACGSGSSSGSKTDDSAKQETAETVVETVTEAAEAVTEEAAEEAAPVLDPAIDTEGKSTDFSMLALTAITLDQYSDYNEFPAIEYWMDMEWDPNGDGTTTKANIDLWAPTAGAESDYVNTLISTGDYPDVMNLQFASQSAAQMYEDGWTLDLTDYVKAYMPNYLAWLDEHPNIIATNTVDGEEKYLQIYSGNKNLADHWGGYLYRRDWVVSYLTNPTTGEAFTGEWVENEDGTKDWVDDVVFPSGKTYPETISDWEWMMEGFKPVVDQLAESVGYGYCTQLSYAGAMLTGDLVSGFGGIGSSTYIDADGNIAFGGTSEGMRAYVECMTNWYANGWIDPNFAERASDMFFMIDVTTIYTGTCGIWYGLNSQLLDGLAGDGSNPLTAGAVVFACPSPINDKYGDEAVQNTIPTTFYDGGYLNCGWVITDAAADKDIATLLTAIDYLYSDEGSLLFSRGISSDIMAGATGEESWYKKYVELELPNGAYSMGEDGIPVIDPSLVGDNNNRSEAAIAQRLCGLANNINNDGSSKTKREQLDLWKTYEAAGYIQGDITSQLSAADATANSTFGSNLGTTVAQWIPLYIMGQYDVTNDEDWQKYCDEVNALDPDSVVAALQAVVDSAK